MTTSQRTIRAVPLSVIILLILSLSGQMIWHQQLPPPQPQIHTLTPPPSVQQLQLLSLGEPVVLAKILMLWLQTFDNQDGLFIPYQQLNYDALTKWLERILHFDPKSQYPLLTATHIYSMVGDVKKQRQMLAFVYKAFLEDPQHRWPWLAQATILAKHRLKDLPLALKYAQALSQHADAALPDWVQEMQIFILEDMGELEQARLVIGGLLMSNQITDPKEIKFLNDKLQALEAALNSAQ